MEYLLMIIAIIGLYLLAAWHAKRFACVCKNCGNKFTLTAVEDFLSFQGLTTKYAKCPQCNKRTWAKVVNK